MKRLIFCIAFISCNCVCVYAQRKIQPEIGFSGYTSEFGYYNTNKVHDFPSSETHQNPHNSGNSYFGFNANLGSRFQLRDKSLLACAQYQSLNSRDIYKHKEIITSNLLGVGVELRLFEKNRIRLLFNMQLMTEIYSNDKNTYLRKISYIPISSYSVNPLSSQSEERVETNIYIGTPFLGNFLIGLNVRIIDDLSFNFSAGYGMRLLKSQLASLTYVYDVSLSQPIKQENINSPYLLPFHMLDFQAGLSYTFSMKKKFKTEEL